MYMIKVGQLWVEAAYTAIQSVTLISSYQKAARFNARQTNEVAKLLRESGIGYVIHEVIVETVIVRDDSVAEID